ncbi:MAG TPA: hypothetical protein VH816_01880 [Gaiellaceae bacterium]
MKGRLFVLCAGVLLLAPAAAAAAPPRVVFHATTHTPKVNARWPWSVTVTTSKGKRLAARVSAAIVDPIGGVHPVEYDCCKRKLITNVRIKGRFGDVVKFPLSSKGFRLTFRVTVRSALGTRVVDYWVKAR